MKIPLVIVLLFIATLGGAKPANDLENVLAQFVKKGADDWMSFFDFVKSAERKHPHKVGRVVVKTLLLEVLQRRLSVSDLKPLQVLGFAVGRESGTTTTEILTLFTAKTPTRVKLTCEAVITATIRPPTLFHLIIPALPQFELLGHRLRCNHKIVVKTGPPLDRYAHHKVSHVNSTHKHAHPLLSKSHNINHHPKVVKHLSSPHKGSPVLHKPLNAPHQTSPHLSNLHSPVLPHKLVGKPAEKVQRAANYFDASGSDDLSRVDDASDNFNSESDDLSDASESYDASESDDLDDASDSDDLSDASESDDLSDASESDDLSDASGY